MSNIYVFIALFFSLFFFNLILLLFSSQVWNGILDYLGAYCAMTNQCVAHAQILVVCLCGRVL
jgi:hypothetical protein